MSHTERYVAATSLGVAAAEAFAYHDRPGALDRLIPPWENAVVEATDNSLAVGSRVVLTTKLGFIPLRWVAEHTKYDPPDLFADTSISGPFTVWDHHHRFVSSGDEQSLLRDEIDYRLPGGAVGRILGGAMARRAIEAMFAYRHQVTRDDLDLMQSHDTSPMTVAISGATGLVGKQFGALMTLMGHRTIRLVRKNSDDENEIAIWTDPQSISKLEGVDAVVHLAGKPIADGRWSDSVKQEIMESRVAKTRQLCESLAKLEKKPRVLICASATGVYGDRGDEELSETSTSGNDFLADVVNQWEQACQAAIDAGIRVVNARLGIVLTPRGGALQKMLLPAKLMGGSLGSGKQWWSWIALDDVLGAIYHAIHDQSMQGPVNFVAPQPATNRDFARTLGRVIRRPALFPAPAFALRLVMGEMADALLLASTKVTPNLLMQSTYKYRFTGLEETLRYYLGKNRVESIE